MYIAMNRFKIVLGKEKEFEVLTQEMFERSKSKFREIDVLKKKLSEAERSLVRIYFCYLIGLNKKSEIYER